MRENPKVDCDLGYSNFTLQLTIHLPHPHQNVLVVVPNAIKIKD